MEYHSLYAIGGKEVLFRWRYGVVLTSRSMAISFSAAAFFNYAARLRRFNSPPKFPPPNARAGYYCIHVDFLPGTLLTVLPRPGKKAEIYTSKAGRDLLIKVCRQINKNNNQNPPKSCAWHRHAIFCLP
jgi:hypothetical protein